MIQQRVPRTNPFFVTSAVAQALYPEPMLHAKQWADSDLQSSRCLIAAVLCFLCGWHGPNPSKSIQSWWLFSFGPRANARELRQNAWHFGPKSGWSGTVRWQVGDLPRLFHQRHSTGRTSLPPVDDPWEAWFSIGFFSCPYVGRWF